MCSKSLVWLVVLAVVLSGSATVFAAKKSARDQVTSQAYGTAGCGLGSIAFGNKKGMIQVLAATTNGTFGTQTFGISSGTSNCDSDSGDQAANLNVFVESNKLALANDVARGNGETLASLSRVLGCQNQQTLGSVLQKNYTRIFVGENASSSAISESIITTVHENGTLATTCSI